MPCGTGKRVCPWGFGRASSIETAPSNKFGGATRRYFGVVGNANDDQA
jgi:hypothetical protein